MQQCASCARPPSPAQPQPSFRPPRTRQVHQVHFGAQVAVIHLRPTALLLILLPAAVVAGGAAVGRGAAAAAGAGRHQAPLLQGDGEDGVRAAALLVHARGGCGQAGKVAGVVDIPPALHATLYLPTPQQKTEDTSCGRHGQPRANSQWCVHNRQACAPVARSSVPCSSTSTISWRDRTSRSAAPARHTPPPACGRRGVAWGSIRKQRDQSYLGALLLASALAPLAALRPSNQGSKAGHQKTAACRCTHHLPDVHRGLWPAAGAKQVVNLLLRQAEERRATHGRSSCERGGGSAAGRPAGARAPPPGQLGAAALGSSVVQLRRPTR